MAGSRRAAPPRKRKKGSGGFPVWTVLLLIGAVAGLALLKNHLERRPPRVATPEPPRQEGPPAPKPRPKRRPPPRPAETRPAPLPPAAAGIPPPSPGTPAGRAPQETPAPPPEGPASDLAPRPVPAGPPRVALVLDDAGYKLDLVREAVRVLPRSVTFAVIPFLPESTASDRVLHQAGFPVILHAPMEPEDSGRWKPTGGELFVGMPEAEVAAILSRGLEQVPHAEGVNNHMGSRATKDAALMGAVAAYLGTRHLYFLDSRTTPDTVAYAAARRAGLPCAQRAVFLDDTDAPGAIMAQFDALAARAQREGEAVGIGHVRANTLSVLAARIPLWESRGVRFVPLREVVR